LSLAPIFLRPTNSFGLDGDLALLIGQRVLHAKRHRRSEAERQAWEKRCAKLEAVACQAMTVREWLGVIRSPVFNWS
jgi:hypothetical protein